MSPQQSKLNNLEVAQIRNRIHAVITIASKCNQPITYDEISLMLPPVREEINIREIRKNRLAIL